MKVWIIEEAANYTGAFLTESVHKTKVLAEKRCRSDGFKWDSSQGLFCSDTYCRRMERFEVHS